MGEEQIWQCKELGRDTRTLRSVLSAFRVEGVQGIESQQALTAYIGSLEDRDLERMCAIDKEAALQIFVDCIGVVKTAEKYSEWENEETKRVNEALRRELMIARCKADLYDFYADQGKVHKEKTDKRKEKKGK